MAYDKVIDSAILDADLTAIANAIRAKTGGTDKLTLDQMAADIEAIDTYENLTDVLAEQEALIEEIKVALEGKAAGGGASLDVIAASSLPATVVDNQIVVITSTTPGTIYVDTDEPASPASGDIWGQVRSNDIGVDIGDGIRIGVGATRQYINSQWEYLDAYLGKNNTWEQFSVSANSTLENNSWPEIHLASKLGMAPELWEIGDKKSIDINGVSYDVEIIDFDHDDLADGGGKAGITFCLVNCLATLYPIHNVNDNSVGWGGCNLRTTLQSTIFNQLSSDLRSVIKQVIKKAGASATDGTIKSYTDTLFLLATEEIHGTDYFAHPGEGVWYPRFVTSSDREKRRLGTTTSSYWWLRGPSTRNASYWTAAGTSGSTGVDTNINNGQTSQGVVFGFCV